MPPSDHTATEDLPDDSDALADIATDETVDPYDREAAIKHLAQLPDTTHILKSLANGDALTSIEATLAESKLNDIDQRDTS